MYRSAPLMFKISQKFFNRRLDKLYFADTKVYTIITFSAGKRSVLLRIAPYLLVLLSLLWTRIPIPKPARKISTPISSFVTSGHTTALYSASSVATDVILPDSEYIMLKIGAALYNPKGYKRYLPYPQRNKRQS
jgi:hypothetical protein